MLGLVSKEELIVYISDNFMITSVGNKYFVYSPVGIHIIDDDIFRRSIKLLGVTDYEIRPVEEVHSGN